MFRVSTTISQHVVCATQEHVRQRRAAALYCRGRGRIELQSVLQARDMERQLRVREATARHNEIGARAGEAAALRSAERITAAAILATAAAAADTIRAENRIQSALADAAAIQSLVDGLRVELAQARADQDASEAALAQLLTDAQRAEQVAVDLQRVYQKENEANYEATVRVKQESDARLANAQQTISHMGNSISAFAEFVASQSASANNYLSVRRCTRRR